MEDLYDRNKFLYNILSLIENFNENITNELNVNIQLMSLSPHERAFLLIYKDILELQTDVTAKISIKDLSLKFTDLTQSCNPENILFSSRVSNEIACKFKRNYSHTDTLQSILIKDFCNIFNNDLKGINYSVLSYILGELICNIQEHSSALFGYIYMCGDVEKQKIYICIADNGITIPGSYIVSGKKEYQSMIGLDSLEALRYSVRGLSTKNRPLSENRGYGISTNKKMIVEGLHGEFNIFSGNNLYSSFDNNDWFIGLPEGIRFDGTIIFITLPMKVKNDFNFYKYIS